MTMKEKSNFLYMSMCLIWGTYRVLVMSTFKLKPATHVCISGLLTDTSLSPFVCVHFTVVGFYPWVQEVWWGKCLLVQAIWEAKVGLTICQRPVEQYLCHRHYQGKVTSTVIVCNCRKELGYYCSSDTLSIRYSTYITSKYCMYA